MVNGRLGQNGSTAHMTNSEYDDKEDAIVLRTAHQDKFFYVFIDYLSDLDK